MGNDNYIDIDFHVHTPASATCYNYNNLSETEAYIDFLFKAKEARIKGIYVTDHNTIKGYRRLLEIEKESRATLELLGEFGTDLPEHLALKKTRLESILAIFNSVLFLPGLEFTTQDQIHMLILFDKNINLDLIEQFLYTSGYGPEVQGQEDVDTPAKWSALDLLQEIPRVFGEKAILIGAHADRDKGIWRLAGSKYRASIFRTNKLVGVCYNSPSTKDAITGVLKNKEYDRNNVPLAFLQASDFHNNPGQKIGIPRTYVSIDTLDFQNLYKAFGNPDEHISAPVPRKTYDIVQSLATDSNNVCISSLSNEGKEVLFESACAFSNNGPGTIVIGIKNGQPVGVEIDDNGIELLVELIREKITPSPSISKTVYSFGKRVIISFRINKGLSSLYSYNDKFYIRKNLVNIIASTDEIVSQVENRVFSRFNDILISNRKRLHRIMDLVSGYSDGLETMQYVNTIDRNAEYLKQIVNIQVISKPQAPMSANGSAEAKLNGNVIALDESLFPRSKVTIARVTPPLVTIVPEEVKAAKIKSFAGEKVIISSRGSSHYDNSDLPIVTRHQGIVLTINNQYKQKISAKILTAYLKSSCLLYYVHVMRDTTNIFLPDVFKIARVPINISESQKTNIETLVDDIINLEKKYLHELIAICSACQEHDSEKTNKPCSSHTEKHNQATNVIMKKIDLCFYEVLGLDDSTIKHVEEKSNISYPDSLSF